MSPQEKEVAILAVIHPAPGKTDRLRGAIIEAIKWIEANEPDTLEFSLYEETSEDSGVKFAMVERYASQAAMEKHESSDNYKEFFKVIMEEQLLVGQPLITKGRYCHSFRR